jgi:outer membrane protein assembly factor BamB
MTARRFEIVFFLAMLACVPARPLSAGELGEAKPWKALTFHNAAKPLAAKAKSEAWPRFLGPNDNAVSRETDIQTTWPESGPALVWEVAKGSGYASPSIADDRLFFFHRTEDGNEALECLDPETGRRFWSFSYPIEYRDRYGFSGGPRASPVIDGDRVYLFGVTAMAHCLKAATGKVIWKRDLMADYNIPQYFFGSGPTPLIWENLLIQNIGGREAGGKGACVCAFDKMTGVEVWRADDEWGASYASPVVTKLRGKECLLVLAGGESRPAAGGLLCIDPASGKVHSRFPWRADKYESVNASTPLPIDDKRVFISECYMIGGVMLEFDEALQPKAVWKSREFGMHWMTPIQKDGYLYGFAGRNEPDAYLRCVKVDTGEEMWADELRWSRKFTLGGTRPRTQNSIWSFFRGSLLQVEGTFLGLGELGTLGRFDLSPKGPGLAQQIDLFTARETWSLPVLHRGLLYVLQHSDDLVDKSPPRLLCFDFRAAADAASEAPQDSDAATEPEAPLEVEPSKKVVVTFEGGDRVVLLGNTFIERDANYGHIETLLTAAISNKDVTFRNLGWSGDSVYGHSRSYFGPPEEGFNRLKAHLELIKPTVVVLNYGAVAAFEGEAGLPKFIEGYGKLLDMVAQTTGARLVLLTPPPCETLEAPLPDMTAQNERLSVYRDAIQALAKKRKIGFADLFGTLGEGKIKHDSHRTENGVHFTEEGYAAIAPAVLESLGIQAPALQADHAAALRSTVNEKNQLFFYRWRPQNETYLRGFRKHEQGNNAKEIPMFDPLVAAKDKEIGELKKEKRP